ncbi:MAG: hypothetical protein ACI3VN_12030 [Candidatus Onthomonas sp.]
MSTIAYAPDIHRLLDGDRAVERGLSRVLCSELALIDYLYAQTITCG